MKTISHPSTDQLRDYVLGKLSASDSTLIEEHVQNCHTCVLDFPDAPSDTLLNLLQSPKPAAAEVPPANVKVPSGGALSGNPRFEVIKQLGSGGMGVVYLANHRMMNRLVALKQIRPDLLATPAAVERFRREVQMAGQLAQSNIVTTHDADEYNGQHFMVMEYVEGRSLDRLIEEKGPLPVHHACAIARQVALGLEHAHQKKMIHRDIKPHNIMLTKQGKVKILDFGLARWNADQPEKHDGSTFPAVKLTQTHGALGTPHFAAPEQVKASTADHRADLYGLGGTLVYLLTGKVPLNFFDAQTKGFEFPETVPVKLRELLSSLLARNPNHRPASAKQVAEDLLPWTKVKLSEPAAFAFPMIEKKHLLLAGAVLLPLLLLGLLWLTWPKGKEDDYAKLFTTKPSSPAPSSFSRPAKTTPNEAPSDKQQTRTEEKNEEDPIKKGSSPELELNNDSPKKLESDSTLENLRKEREFKAAVKNDAPAKPPVKDEPPPTQPSSENKPKVVFLLGRDNLWYDDFKPAKETLENAGIEVFVATPGKVSAQLHREQKQRTNGQPVTADMDLLQIDPAKFDAFICVGGFMQDLMDYKAPAGKKTAMILQYARTHQKWVVGICGGQKTLESTGVMKGANRARLNDAAKNYGIVVNQGTQLNDPVVVSGTLITAAGPPQAAEAAQTLADQLLKKN